MEEKMFKQTNKLLIIAVSLLVIAILCLLTFGSIWYYSTHKNNPKLSQGELPDSSFEFVDFYKSPKCYHLSIPDTIIPEEHPILYVNYISNDTVYMLWQSHYNMLDYQIEVNNQGSYLYDGSTLIGFLPYTGKSKLDSLIDEDNE